MILPTSYRYLPVIRQPSHGSLVDAIEVNVYVESDWKKRPSDWDRE
jgi:hypothetical protein